MENAIIQHNIYKFENLSVNMTQVNGKELEKLSLKEIKKYLNELDMWYRVKLGEEDIKAGRVMSEEEVYDYFNKKCQKK